MNFLSKVLFDERMTELEFDIFYKLWTISGVHPEKYEAVLMIDADTKIDSDSMTHLVASMAKDPLVIGACGETTIENKWQSWVTAIQVYEYFTSHHLNKSFESTFGFVSAYLDVLLACPGAFQFTESRFLRMVLLYQSLRILILLKTTRNTKWILFIQRICCFSVKIVSSLPSCFVRFQSGK